MIETILMQLDLSSNTIMIDFELENAATLIDSVVASSPPDTFYVDNGLTNGQEYFYRVTAYDSTGSESGFSNDVSAIPYLPIVSTSPAQNRERDDCQQ